jgi:flagellar basal body L-ring protein FlgH
MKQAIFFAVLLLAGCGYRVEKNAEPAALLPVGAGVQNLAMLQDSNPSPMFPATPTRSLWNDRGAQMFRDRRASGPGDIVTVLIDVDDRAALIHLALPVKAILGSTRPAKPRPAAKARCAAQSAFNYRSPHW